MKFILFLTLFITLINAKSNFQIIEPNNKTIFKEAFVSIIIKLPLNHKIDKILITHKSKKYEIFVKNKRKVYCTVVNLDKAMNNIKIYAFFKKKKVSQKELEVFYQDDIFEEAVEAPANFKKEFFHRNKNEFLCKSCHNMRSDNSLLKKQNNEFFRKNQKSYNKVLNKVEESNCFDCHKSLISRKNKHAPSVNLVCTQCHTGNSSSYNEEDKNKSKYLNPDPIDNACFSCHDTKKESWYSKKSKHGPVMTGRCTKCHNPHSSNNLFFMKKPIWDLCTTCHDEKAKGKHILASFVFTRNKGAHPTKGRKDPSRPYRELVCSSCHNPHGSDSFYLLRMEDTTSSYGVCKRCHKK